MLTPTQRKEFKRRAHALKPVVLLGHNGLTPAVTKEIDIALESHELIKVKIPEPDREISTNIVTSICNECGADLVGKIGRIAIFYRARKEVKK